MLPDTNSLRQEEEEETLPCRLHRGWGGDVYYPDYTEDGEEVSTLSRLHRGWGGGVYYPDYREDGEEVSALSRLQRRCPQSSVE